MGNFRRYLSFNNVAMALTLGSFAPVAALPAQQNVQMNIGLNDVAFGYNIIKLADKGKSLLEKMNRKDEVNDSNSKKLLSVMFDLKNEICNYTGIKIDIDREIDNTVYEMKKQGTKLSSSQVKDIKKIFKEKGKKHHHKALFFADCMNYGIDFNEENESLYYGHELDYDVHYCAVRDSLVFRAKAAKHDKEDGKEIVVPLKLIVGVTGTLCGFFVLMIPLPIPGKQQAGMFLVTTGLKYSCDAVIEAMEERQKEGK